MSLHSFFHRIQNSAICQTFWIIWICRIVWSIYVLYTSEHNFTVVQKNVGSLLFLDAKICRKNGKFVINVYRKPTFGGTFINYESFIPAYQKRGLSHILLHRIFSICYDFKNFHFEINHLKTVLIKNNYHFSFMDSCIKSFSNKLYTPKVMIPNKPKRNGFIKLPFLGST